MPEMWHCRRTRVRRNHRAPGDFLLLYDRLKPLITIAAPHSRGIGAWSRGETMTSLAQSCSFAALALVAGIACASAQQPLPQPSQAYPPAGVTVSAREQTCQRLETQLAAINGAASDVSRGDQIRRLEEAMGRQQAELDRTQAQARRQGCEASGFFQIFGGVGRSEQCGTLNNQIQQMRANLARVQGDLQRMQGAGASVERDGQRRAILSALVQNECGAQYRAQAARAQGPGNFFEQLFGGPGSVSAPEQDGGGGGGYRTVCVRTCDGYFFPISHSTSQDRFRDDEATCQRMCPAAEVQLFSHRTSGEDMRQAISTSGKLYTEMPTAFKYKTEWNNACACKQPGESWANAVKDDPRTQTLLEQGDIVVTEERAKVMNAPRDAKGRPMLPPSQAQQKKGGAPAPAAAAAPVQAAPEPEPDPNAPKKPIRSVGPKFMAE